MWMNVYPVVNNKTEKLLEDVLGLENFIESIIKTSPEKLAKPVSEIMSTNPLTCSPEDEIDVWRLTQNKSLAGLPVTAKNKLLGIVTSMDIIRFFGSVEVFKHLKSGTITQVLNTPAPEIAAEEVATIAQETDVGQAAEIMREKNLRALTVVQDERLVGIITEKDFLKIVE